MRRSTQDRALKFAMRTALIADFLSAPGAAEFLKSNHVGERVHVIGRD